MVRPTLLWGVTSIDPADKIVETASQAPNAMVLTALGIFKRHKMSWADHYSDSRRRGAECIVRATREPWHCTLARFHWRLLSLCSRMAVEFVCHKLLRDGWLLHEHTLRAIQCRGTHRRPGP